MTNCAIIELTGFHRLDGMRIEIRGPFPPEYFVPARDNAAMSMKRSLEPQDLTKPCAAKLIFERTQQVHDGARVYRFKDWSWL